MHILSSTKSKILTLTLVAIAWAMYACTVLSSQHLKKVDFNIERWAIASTVSHVLFHGPSGGNYIEIMDKFKQGGPTKSHVDSVRSNGIVNKGFTGHFGEDGFTLVFIYNLAMHLFGVNIYAIFWLFASLLLISHIVYSLRFTDYRFIFAPLSLFIFSLMIFTPYITNEYFASQVPVGGYRYFTILAALPLIHLLFEFADESQTNAQSLFYLAAQTVLIGLANFVAKSAAYSLVAIVLFSLLYFYNKRKDAVMCKLLLKKLSFVMLILVAFSMLFYTIAIPKVYKKAGIATDNFWHRVWISMGVHPEWPFEDVKEKYASCAFPPKNFKGLQKGTPDWNGECVWDVYLAQHPNVSRDDYRKYQRVQRDAFFRVLLDHPLKVFETFSYYKIKLSITNAIKGFNYGYSNPSHTLKIFFPLIISSLVLFFSWLYSFSKASIQQMYTTTYVMTLIMASIFTMYIVAWGSYITMFEFFFMAHLFILLLIMILMNVVYAKNKLVPSRI